MKLTAPTYCSKLLLSPSIEGQLATKSLISWLEVIKKGRKGIIGYAID